MNFSSFLKHKQLSLSAIVFLIIFLSLGVPYTKWGFDIDDCGVIWHSRILSFSDFSSLLGGNDVYSFLHPVNYKVQPQYFFNVFYRPFYRVLCGLQYYFFAGNPYGYFLVMIFFHALNATILFNIFFMLLHSFVLAFWGALYFAYQSHLSCWMGWIAAQFYPVSFFCILLSLLLFFYHIKSKQHWPLYISLVMYAFSLFSVELVIVWPIFLGSLFFIYNFLHKQLALPMISLANYLKKVSTFFIVVFMYLGLRLILYPINISDDPGFARCNTFNFLNQLQYRLGDLLSFLVDIANISFIPAGNHLIKGSIVGSFLLFLSYLFYKNRQKKEVLYCAFITILFMWPAILRFYVPRYFYHASGCFVFMILLLLHFYKREQSEKKYFLMFKPIICIGILCLNMIMLQAAFSARENKLNLVMQAYDNIVKTLAKNEAPLYFVGLPREPFRAALAQALWMRGLPSYRQIYYDVATFTSLEASDYSRGINVNVYENNVKLSSYDEMNLWFADFHAGILSMGEKKILRSDSKTNRIYEIEYIFNANEYTIKNLCFVTWDYEKSCFKTVAV